MNRRYLSGRVNSFPGIFFFICEDQLGLQCADLFQVQGFCATHAGFIFKPALGMDTKLCDTHNLLLEAELRQQFRLRWHQRNDPGGLLGQR